MKHTSLIALILIIGTMTTVGVRPVAAQSPTVKESTSSGKNQLDDLKARLATKVAELRTVVKKAMYGTVKTISVSSASIETKTKDIKIELTDDVTVAQMIDGKRSTLSIEDIETGDPLTVFGTYDETLDLLKANHIFIESSVATQRLAGIVSDSDDKAFVLTVHTTEGRNFTVDIEKTTKTTLWTKSGGIVKGGFSKIAVGDTVHIVGKPSTKSENRMSAIKILDIGNITGATATPATEPTPAEEASPSATPRSTPRTTPRVTPRPTVTP